MSKRLELTVYPTFWLSGNLWTTEAPGATISAPIDVDYWVACKRFTDAELAAELLGMEIEWRSLQGSRYAYRPELERCDILYRFAALPHYDGAAA